MSYGLTVSPDTVQFSNACKDIDVSVMAAGVDGASPVILMYSHTLNGFTVPLNNQQTTINI